MIENCAIVYFEDNISQSTASLQKINPYSLKWLYYRAGSERISTLGANSCVPGISLRELKARNYQLVFNSESGGGLYVTILHPFQTLCLYDSERQEIANLASQCSKPGYVFDGWQLSNGTKILEANGTPCNETYFKSTGSNSYIWNYPDNLILTPHYIPYTYYITYNGNGNTGGSAPANTTHQYDTASNLAVNTFKKEYTVSFNGNGGIAPDPIVSRYNFRAWRHNSTGWEWGSGATKAAANNLTSTNGATETVYAQWDGGAITLPNATKNAYNLDYWYNGVTRIGGAGTQYVPITNITLTANWALDTKNIDGQITWNDQENRYGARPQTVDVTLTSDDNGPREAGALSMTPNPVTTVTGQTNTSYSFANAQTRKVSNDTNYNYTVSQNQVTGYKTTTNGYNITNELVLPHYSSSITYTPVDSFQNALLKNGKVKINAQVKNTDGVEYPELGVHNADTILNIDEGINLDYSTLKVYVTNRQGLRVNTSSYITNGNQIIVKHGITSAEKIDIEITGTLKEIKEYSSNISLTGDLRDLRGENTSIHLGELTRADKTATVQYQLTQAKLQLTKKDSITKEALTDAEFKLYEWNGENYVEKETITDTDGDGIYESSYYEWNKQTEGKYKVEEITTPGKHKNLNFNMEYMLNRLEQQNYTVLPDYNDNTQVTKIEYTLRNPDGLSREQGTVENEPFKIKVAADILDAETLRQIQSPATFKIFEWDNQTGNYKPYISSLTGNEVTLQRQQDKTYLANEWLYYKSTNEGKYRIEEIEAPIGYYGDYLDDNATQKRTYDINILDIVSENERGNEVTINLTNDEGMFKNQRAKANIVIHKVDSETKGEAQGNAKLQGAIYEIYARENIYNADGLTERYEKVDGETLGKYYQKDELISTVETNEEGIASFENLECGNYYVKEKAPSEGYFIDETTYTVDVPYKDQNTKIVKEERTSEEKVKKQGIKIYNAKVNDAGEHEPLQNIGYTIYRISDLQIVKDGKITRNNDGTYTLNDEEAKKDASLKKQANRNGTYKIATLVNYYYKLNQKEGKQEEIPQDELTYHPYRIEEQKVKDYSKETAGVEIGELRTDEKGYVTSPELAYGEYVVVETSVPKELEAVRPLYIKITEDSREPRNLQSIIDKNFQAKAKIYAKDETTGNPIMQQGIKYLIYDETGNPVTTYIYDMQDGYVEYGSEEHPYVTTKNGYFMTPKLETGKYTLKQLDTPNGYILNMLENGEENEIYDFEFEINSMEIYYVDDIAESNVVVIDSYNTPQVGQMKLTLEGEYVNSAEKQEDGQYTFTYEKRPIQNGVFEIKAREDIYSIDGHNEIIYTKDQKVTTITTDEEGNAYTKNLPQGKYYIKEITAGNGFTLNSQIKEFQITYGANNKELEIGTPQWKEEARKTPVTYYQENYENQRQNLKITVNKVDEETKEKIPETEIGIYTKEDIINEKTKNTLVPQNELVQKAITNENGQIEFANNLPFNMYYLKEEKAQSSYVKNNNTYDINGIYEPSQVEEKTVSQEITNHKTEINIQKIDQNGQVQVGVTLQIKDSKGNIVQEWQTEEQPKNIKGLNVNEEYKIVEKTPLPGYAKTEEITFTINEEGRLQTSASTSQNNTILLQSGITKIDINLKDIETKEQVLGAVLKLEDANGQEIEKWTTNGIAKHIEKLPIGKYKIVEEQTPYEQGYVTIKPMEFEVTGIEDTQEIEVLQGITKLAIQVIDPETGKLIPGLTIQIIKKETVTNENGEEETKETVVASVETKEEPVIVTRIPVGKYILRQVNIDEDSGQVTTPDIEIEIKDTNDIQTPTNSDNPNGNTPGNGRDQNGGRDTNGDGKPDAWDTDGDGKDDAWDTDGDGNADSWDKNGNGILDDDENNAKNHGNGRDENGGRDTNGDGRPDAWDLNGDGKDDAWDTNGDGKPDAWDTDGDGNADSWDKNGNGILDDDENNSKNGGNGRDPNGGRDTNGDGKPDAWDTNGDGKDDTWDTDYDGKPDAWDTDGDGNADSWDKNGNGILDDDENNSKNGGNGRDKNGGKDTNGDGKPDAWDIDGDDKDDSWDTDGDGNADSWDKNKNGILDDDENNAKNHGDGRDENGGRDTNKDGRPDAWDTNGDGKDDAWDTNGDGKPDAWDTDGDGNADSWDKNGNGILDDDENNSKNGGNGRDENGGRDTNGDGRPDAWDTNGDGKDDAWDTNGDGKPDAWDTDGDGNADSWDKNGNGILDDDENNSKKGGITGITQAVTKLDVYLKDEKTGNQVEGATLKIISKKTNNVVKEWTTTDKQEHIEKLAIGDYILEQTQAKPGYLVSSPVEFSIKNTVDVQTAEMTNNITKLEVRLLDIDTKEHIVGGNLQIVEKESKKIVDEWLNGNEARKLERIPQGNYTLIQTQAPGLRGYKISAPIDFEVKETSELQVVEMLEDYTKTTINVGGLKDENGNNPLKGVTLILKDEKGNVVSELTPDENGNYIIGKVPVGKYFLELKEPIYGYKPLHQEIQITQKDEMQIDIKLEKEPFDIRVETWIDNVQRNARPEYLNKKQEQKVRKVDVKDKKIKTENIKVSYKIRIKNISKINGVVGEIINNIPSGMTFNKDDNKGYWKEENGKIISTALAEKTLKENAYAELEITFRWKNGLENFGTKENSVEIQKLTSDIGWKDENESNNKAKSAGVIIGVSTGDMNLVWACWILLAMLIIAEVTITKKLKIKKFGLHDRTLKYAKKYKKQQEKKNKKE